MSVCYATQSKNESNNNITSLENNHDNQLCGSLPPIQRCCDNYRHYCSSSVLSGANYVRTWKLVQIFPISSCSAEKRYLWSHQAMWVAYPSIQILNHLINVHVTRHKRYAPSTHTKVIIFNFLLSY